MTINEGRVQIEECLKDCHINASLEELICYKYGYVKKSSEYHSANIPTSTKKHEIEPTMKFVVKCFIYPEIYVAWPIEVGLGNGKYIAYRNDLVDMEARSDRLIG